MASDKTTYQIGSAIGSENHHSCRYRSLKWQIISIAFVSVIGLTAFVVRVIIDAGNEASLLNEIQEQSYPIQANLLAAVHKLEFIHRELENAVTTGDEETALSTDQTATDFRKNMLAVGRITKSADVPNLLKAFDQYHQQSRQLALTLIDPTANIESLLETGQKNSLAYVSLQTRLNSVYRNSNQKFAEEIASATHRASQSVRFAVIGGVLVVIMVVAIAVLTADSIIKRIRGMVDKLKTIALENGDLKVRLDLAGADEMSELAYWFNKIIAKLEDTRRAAENDILRIANTDELSGLYNRRFLMTWLHDRIEREIHNDCFSAVFLDLDEFKPVNDTYGHEVGDQLIVQVASRLSEFMVNINLDQTGINTSIEDTVACRLGGDEFMLILPAVTDRAALSEQIAELCDDICAPYDIGGIYCEVGVSIGVSRFPIDATDPGLLLDRADMAMYEAKRRGKRQFAFYEEDLERRHGFQNLLVQSLKNPKTESELYLVYQPKVSIQGGGFVGAEALLRWESAELGSVSPDVFIPLAEEKKLIFEIDMWVLDQVCKQVRQWQLQGLDLGVVAVNISAQTLLRPQLTQAVADVLHLNGVDPLAIQLEITESAVLDLSDGLTDTINSLRELGVSIAMDDFGAGHSSLMFLINNQIDLVKLDKSLIDEIGTNLRHQRIVHSVVTLAHSLNVSTLAEGIESEDQLEYLRSIMCNEGQGYFFSKPLPAHEYQERYLLPTAKKAAGF